MALAGLLWAIVQAPTLVGRWDLTVTQGRDRFPSWLEIVEQQGSFTGRFQGRFGHATPIDRLEIMGDRFRFVWPDEADRTAPVTTIAGEIRDGTMTGTIEAPGEAAATFTARRAPPLDRTLPPRFGPAIDLLAGGLAEWTPREPKSGWRLAGGVLTNALPSSDLITRRRFTDFRLRLEVNVPPGGNSGIYLRGRHEVQVQDDYGKSPHSRRMGGVYGQVTPTVQPAKPAGEWQTFEITLIGRRVTVALNGVTMVDQAEIPGITGGALDSEEGKPGPLMLQGDHTEVRYRRITIEPAVVDSSAVALELARLERARFDAQIRRDTAALGNLLGDDLVYIHSNGLVESKARFIESVATGRIGYDSVVPLEMSHRIDGATAVGHGRVRVQARLNGQLARLDLLFTTVHARRAGRWRLIAWQSTRVP